MGQAQPLTPTDGSPGGRRRCHLHSTFPPDNGCAHCLLGKKERGTASKAGGSGASAQGASAQGGFGPPADRQAGSLLTIDHHVVAQDTGRVEGSLPWAL